MSTYRTIWEHAKRKTGQTNLTDVIGLEYTNFALDDLSFILIDADGRWKFDDTQRSDLPTAFAAAVARQNSYVTDISFLQINQVSVKYDDTWRVMQPVDTYDYTDTPIDQQYKEPGRPKYVDFDGNVITLYPAPDFSDTGDLTNTDNLSIRVRHSRAVQTVTDLAQTIGFPSLYRPYMVANVCYQISQAINDNSVSLFRDDMTREERNVRQHLGYRDEMRPRRLKPVVEGTFGRFRRN